MKLIQSHLILPTFKEQYFLKDGDNKPQKISKERYFQLYNESWSNKDIKVLAPITKELINT